VQGAGYSVFEVDTNVTGLELEMDMAVSGQVVSQENIKPGAVCG
jgi:hypothetical protein